MYSWFSLLSTRQRFEMVAMLSIVTVVLIVGILFNMPGESTTSGEFSADMSISEIAPGLGVTGKGLARELKIPLDAPKKKPLSELGISQKQLDHAVEHILSHRSTTLKYYIFAAIVMFGLVYLVRLGRPDNATLSERKIWYPRLPYITCLITSVLVCGFFWGNLQIQWKP